MDAELGDRLEVIIEIIVQISGPMYFFLFI